MQRGIEANAGGQGAAAVAGAAEEVGLGAFAQARLGELLDGVLLAILVDGEVDGAKGAAADLLLDQVLVDAVLGGAVILAVAVLGARIEGFLAGSMSTQCPHNVHTTSTQAPRALRGVSAGSYARTLTCRVLEAARRWCRSGLWYAGVDLGASARRRGSIGRACSAHVLDGRRARVVGAGGDVERGARRVDARRGGAVVGGGRGRRGRRGRRRRGRGRVSGGELWRLRHVCSRARDKGGGDATRLGGILWGKLELSCQSQDARC